jgi:hypothetical protein
MSWRQNTPSQDLGFTETRGFPSHQDRTTATVAGCLMIDNNSGHAESLCSP